MWPNIRLPKEVAREFIGGAEELKRGKTMRAGQRPEAAVAPRSVMIPFASITVSSRVGFAELSAPKKLGTRQRVLSPGGHAVVRFAHSVSAQSRETTNRRRDEFQPRLGLRLENCETRRATGSLSFPQQRN